jgi:hypothetical protein
MRCNVGNIDKVLRIFIGFASIAAGVYFGSWWGIIGLVPLLTATAGYCPLYSLFGLSTCPLAK